MARINAEASPIARLIGLDGKRTVGWVYVWETSELAILWMDKPDSAAFIDPKIQIEVLVESKGVTPDAVIALISELPTTNP